MTFGELSAIMYFAGCLVGLMGVAIGYEIANILEERDKRGRTK